MEDSLNFSGEFSVRLTRTQAGSGRCLLINLTVLYQPSDKTGGSETGKDADADVSGTTWIIGGWEPERQTFKARILRRNRALFPFALRKPAPRGATCRTLMPVRPAASTSGLRALPSLCLSSCAKLSAPRGPWEQFAAWLPELTAPVRPIWCCRCQSRPDRC